MKKLLSFLLITFSFTLANRLSAECHAAFTWEQITNTLTIHFFSQSTSDHDITSYSWNFGDGHEGDGQNPTHTYAEAGTYHVCLIIHDNAGCVSDVCHDVVVAPLSNSCEAAFTFELGADNNHLVHFHDASTSNHDIVSWLWHFGDGESSDQQNPTHIYANPGTYQVCLIITDNTGCVSDVCHNVVIPEPDNCEASFTGEPTNDPLTWDFLDASTSDHQIIHWHWTFGDDHSSDDQDPTHTYAQGGTYNVCLSIVSETGCEDQFCMTIQVQGSGSGCHASFTAEPGDNPLIWHFNSTSTSDHDIVNYAWTFGDGGTSDNHAPTHTYDHGGTYTVCLTITDGSGCSDTFCMEITVMEPGNGCHASFTAEPGDNPLIWHFNSTSTSDHDIIHYMWTFGDGGVSDNHAPTHTYDHGGTYTVCLTITDGSGCSDTVCMEITVVEPADECNAAFTANAGDNPLVWHFHDQSTSTHDIVSWAWSFGDGGTSSLQNPEHVYDTAGTYQVCLVITSETGCTSDHCIEITVNEPGTGCHANFTAEPGDNPLIWHFNSTSTSEHEIIHWFWTFGDGGVSDNHAPIHTYEHGGTYEVCLTITDNTGCTDTFCMTITVEEGNNDACHAIFTAEAPGDSTLNWHFFDHSTSTHDIIHWEWHFGDGTIDTVQNPVHLYDSSGVYNVCLIIWTESGCVADHCMLVYVHLPGEGCQAFFTWEPGDDPLNIHFHNHSVSEHDILHFIWHFGDGSSGDGQNPVHHYAHGGTYEVCLTITDNSGCEDTYCEVIEVQDPPCHAQFTWEYNADEDVVHFINTSTGVTEHTQWHWTFGDGETSDLFDPHHHYNENGIYTVCLIMTDTTTDCVSDVCHVYVQQDPPMDEQNGFEGQQQQQQQNFDRPPVVEFNNPAANNLHITYETLATGPVRMELYDLNGNKVFTDQFGEQTKGRYERTIQLPNLQDGLYALILYLPDGPVVKNVIIMK